MDDEPSTPPEPPALSTLVAEPQTGDAQRRIKSAELVSKLCAAAEKLDVSEQASRGSVHEKPGIETTPEVETKNAERPLSPIAELEASGLRDEVATPPLSRGLSRLKPVEYDPLSAPMSPDLLAAVLPSTLASTEPSTDPIPAPTDDASQSNDAPKTNGKDTQSELKNVPQPATDVSSTDDMDEKTMDARWGSWINVIGAHLPSLGGFLGSHDDTGKKDDESDGVESQADFLMAFKEQYGRKPTPSRSDDSNPRSAVGSVTTVQTDKNWRGDRVGKDPERTRSARSDSPRKKPKVGQPMAIQRKGSLWSRLGSRWTASKDRNRTEFERYASELKKANADLEKKIESRGKLMKELRAQQKTDTKKWRKFAEIDLENMARTYYENKMLQCSTQQQVSALRMELIAEKINQVQSVLDGQKIEEVTGTALFDPEGCFYAPEKIPLPDEHQNLQISLDTMTSVIGDLEKQYKARQREADRKMADGVRKAKFMALLDHGYSRRIESRVADKSNQFHYHPPDDKGKQVEFNCLLIDERHSEGQLLKKWRQRVEKTKITAAVLTQFLDYIAKYITKKYELNPDLKGALELYIARLVYPRIMGSDRVTIIKSLRTEREEEHDKIFEKKCLWMRNLSQEDVGIPANFRLKMTEEEQFHFLSISSHLTDKSISKARQLEVKKCYPYASAVLSLHAARRHCVPADLLHCFLDAIRRIHTCAHDYCSDKKINVTADDLFPIIVWVVVHSQLTDINMRLGHMERCLKNSIKHFGEVGICLSLIEAAVAYICRMSPDQFEKDNRRAREKDERDRAR